MADKTAVRITNIVSVTQGSNKYQGVRSVDVIADKGTLAAIFVEGDLYPTGAENMGTAEFPVTTRANFETDTGVALEMIAEPVAPLVVVYKQAGGGANKTLTIPNHQFRRQTTPLAIGALSGGRFAQVSVEGSAFSADGTTLPLSVA